MTEAKSTVQSLQQDIGIREDVCKVQHNGFCECGSRVRQSLLRSQFYQLPTVTCISRTLRREPALTQFETAQIANLCPADAEEAKSIIPRSVPAQVGSLTVL